MRPVLATAVVALVALASAPAWAQARPASSQAGLRPLAWPGKAEASVAPVRPGQPARTRPAAPNRYSARTGTAEPVWNPFPTIAPSSSASLRPAQQPAPPAPQPYRPPVAPAQPPALLRPVAPPPAPAAPQLRQPPGPPMTVARPDRAVAPAQPLRPAAPAPAPIVAAPPPQATLVQPEPPRSYADFSRPMTSSPAPASSPAVARPAAPVMPVDEAPRSYADFSRPMSTPAPQIPAGQAASATGGDRPRYYSVHREYGRTPDHPEIPEAFFLDSVGGEDLAAPPPPPMSERDERRARAAAADPDAPAGQ